MGWRGTVGLVLVVVIAGGYLWTPASPEPEPAPDAPNLLGEPRLHDPSKFVALLPFQLADVVALHVRHGRQELTAQRQGTNWESSRPDAPIDVFLRGIGDLGRIMEIPAGADALGDYGLDAPQSIVELTLADQPQPLALQVGSQNPAATGVYVRINGAGPVVLAGALVTWELDKLFRPPAR